MTEDRANQIEELPFVSKQKSRMAHLLKKKSKVSAERKDRITYEAHDFLKRPRGNPEDNGKGPTNPQSQTQATQSSTKGQWQSYLSTVYADKEK